MQVFFPQNIKEMLRKKNKQKNMQKYCEVFARVSVKNFFHSIFLKC